METSEYTFDVEWGWIAAAALCLLVVMVAFVALKPRARSGQGRRKEVRKRVPKGDPRLGRTASPASPATEDESP